MKKALVGNGGFARDVRALMGAPDLLSFIDDEYYQGDVNTAPMSLFDEREYEVLITVANPAARQAIVRRLPPATRYFSVIHSSAQLLVASGISVGVGSVISANCLLVDNIRLGDHCHLNLGTILGHDVTLGDFFTSAPGVRIMGNNTIGRRVYFGTSASSREKITVCDDVTVGLNAGVVSDLTEPGVYVGTPARRRQ